MIPALRTAVAVAAALVAVLAAANVAAAEDGGSIRAIVHGSDGGTSEGALRWNGRKSFWDQALATQYAESLETRERDETLEVFGLKLWTWKEHDVVRLSVRVPFGLIASMRRTSRAGALLDLRGGGRLEVLDGADLGPGATVEVETDDGGVRTMRWIEVERIEFRPGPPAPRERRRLFGTVFTTAGTFVGFVTWDRDESALDDVLDGDEAEIPFADIASLHRDGRDATRVIRRDGTTVRLTGTNDVDDRNRGIEVRVEGLGTVVVSWDAFESFAIADPPASPAPSAFRDGPLRGRVVTVDGAAHEGEIVWGDHERHRWEAIDGESVPGIALAVEFAAIATIERTDAGARITLRDGGRHDVRGDDAAPDVRPIEVRTPSGSVRIPWSEVAAVSFATVP